MFKAIGYFTMFILIILFTQIGIAQNCVNPSQDIIAWWPMDEESGTSVEDIIGTNPGIHVNGPTHAEGIAGNALRFDGNDYVGVPDNDLWAFGSNDFTIELWANFDLPGGGTIGHPGDIFIGNDEGAGTTRKWFFALGGGRLNFHINGPGIGAQFFPLVPFSPVVGQWYHLAVTRSGYVYTIYVNGVPGGSAVNTRTIPNPNAPLTIGQAEQLGYMNGRLDEITIYNRALLEEELNDIYAAGSAGKCKLMIATRQLSSVKLGESFSQELRVIGGEPPYSWSLISGVLPIGVAFTSEGILSGVPEEAGEFPLIIGVSDNLGNSFEKAYTFDVLLILPPSHIQIYKSGIAPVPGRELDYFILVENIGDATSTEIEVIELLVPVTYYNFVNADPIPVMVNEVSIFWVLSPLEPGQVHLLTYTVDLSASLPIGASIPGAAWAGSSSEGEEVSIDWANHQQTLPCKINSPECQTLLNMCALYGCHPLSNLSVCSACPSIWAECTEGCDACELFPDKWYVNCEPTQGAIDPNEKCVIAPTYIQPEQLLIYPIHFENIGDIEARDVFITDVLDPNLDIFTLEILSPDGASFDEATRTLRWELLDRNLLPGETDNVLLSIQLLPGLPSGTVIRNTADIQFEVFDIYTTNEVVNIIDAIPPEGLMDPLPDEISTLEFPISWSGTDAVGEIKSYSILVSVDGGDFITFLERTSDTSATFSGESGRTYGFICIAEDIAGNIEIQDPVSEVVVTVIAVAGLSGNVSAASEGLLGVPIDLVDSNGELCATTATDDSGHYEFPDIPNGDYTISISTPIGYLADSEIQDITIAGIDITADFNLTVIEVTSEQRGIGFWKHQVHAYLSGRGNAQISLEEFCGFLGDINTHFSNNPVNPITLYAIDQPATQTDSLEAAAVLLSVQGNAPMVERGNQHLMALLLNVVSLRLHQQASVSEDYATASQAITYCWDLLTDEDDSNDEIAKDIAEQINNNLTVAAGAIPLSTPNISYRGNVRNEDRIPETYKLSENFPNPFNAMTTIHYGLPVAAHVTIDIYDLLGRKVATIVNGQKPAGYHRATWNSQNASTGIYLYKIQTEEFIETKKMLLLK